MTKAADTNVVFSREAGVPAPSVKVNITKVNTVGDKYVQIANLAVGAWDLTGWKLVSAGNATYTFPAFSLDNGMSVKVHEGNGSGTATDMYTNSTAPLWIDNVVALQDATGSVISSYDISAATSINRICRPAGKTNSVLDTRIRKFCTRPCAAFSGSTSHIFGSSIKINQNDANKKIL